MSDNTQFTFLTTSVAFASAKKPQNAGIVDVWWLATVGYTPFGALFSTKIAIFSFKNS